MRIPRHTLLAGAVMATSAAIPAAADASTLQREALTAAEYTAAGVPALGLTLAALLTAAALLHLPSLVCTPTPIPVEPTA